MGFHTSAFAGVLEYPMPSALISLISTQADETFCSEQSEPRSTEPNTSLEQAQQAPSDKEKKPVQFPPLELVTKPNLTTAETAYYSNRQPQTLRGWACREDGPLRPKRINGRLAWPVSELRRFLGEVS